MTLTILAFCLFGLAVLCGRRVVGAWRRHERLERLERLTDSRHLAHWQGGLWRS